MIVEGSFLGLKAGDEKLLMQKKTSFTGHKIIVDGWEIIDPLDSEACRVFITVKNWRGHDLKEVLVGEEEINWLRDYSTFEKAVQISAWKVGRLSETIRQSRIVQFFKWNR